MRAACLLSLVVVGLLLVAPTGRAEDAPSQQGRPRIHVVDGAGRPVADVGIRRATAPAEGVPLFDLSAEPLGTTGADGRVRWRNPVPAQAFDGPLVAWAPGQAAVRLDPSVASHTVRLLPAIRIEGLVRYQGGLPAGAVQVLALPEEGPGDLGHVVRTDSDGRYVLDTLHHATWRLFVRRSDGVLTSLGRVRGSGVGPLTELGGGGGIRVKLLDADRTGQAGASRVEVTLVPIVGGGGDAAAPPPLGTSNAEGEVVLGDVPEGIYLAALRSQDWAFEGDPPRVEIVRGSVVSLPDWVVRRRRAVTGRVVDARDEPVGGANVQLLRDPVDDDPEGRALEHLRPITTDGAGRFRIASVEPGEGYRLAVSAAGHGPEIGDPFEVRAGVNTVVPDVRLDPGWEVRVAVQSPAGTPLPGVSVRAVPRSQPGAAGTAAMAELVRAGRTAADGRIRLVDLPLGDVRVEVGGERFLAVRQVVPYPRASSYAEVRISLSEAFSLAGTVLEEDGRRRGPYRLEVRAIDDVQARYVTTDEDGVFEIGGLRPVQTEVSVLGSEDRAGLPLVRRSGLVPGDKSDAIEIVVPRRQVIRGSVVDVVPGGEPVYVQIETARYEPVLERYRWRVVLRRRFEVGDARDVDFEFDSLPPGSYAIRASQGHRDSGAQALYLQDVDIDTLELALPDPARIAGRVLDPEAQPVLGAAIRLERMRGDEQRTHGPGMVAQGATDLRGEFVFEAIGPGLWRLEVTGPDQAPHEDLVRVAEGEIVVLDDIVLGGGGRIEGSAQLAIGVPLDGAVVALRHMDEVHWSRMARTGQDGRFRIDKLTPGLYVLELRAFGTGGDRPEAVVEVLRDETAEVDFTPVGRASVYGTVYRGGRRVSGAQLELVRADIEGGVRVRSRRIETDFAGTYRWDDLPPGSYTVLMRDGTSRHRYQIELAESDRRELDFETFEARIQGHVRSKRGNPVGDAEVVARQLDDGGRVIPGGLEARVRTDPSGAFLLTGLALGPYTLEVRATGWPPGVLPVAQAETDGADLPVEIVLGSGGEIEVAVLSPSGAPVTSARVWVEDLDGIPYHPEAYITGPGGRVHIEGVPMGRVGVRVEAPGFARPEVYRVEIEGTRPAVLSVPLVRPGSLALLVRGTGRDPVARARIDLVRAETGELVERRLPLSRIRLHPRFGVVPRTGYLIIRDLEPDRYRIEIDAGPTYPEVRREFEVRAGEQARVGVLLEPR